MVIAGLDMATETGVCLGEPGQTPEFFSRDLGKGRRHEERFAEAMKLARHLIAERGVTAIGIEAPIINSKRDKKSTNELLMGMIACVRGWAAIKGVACQAIEVATIDKTFLGMRQTGREVRKSAILRQCQMFGWAPSTQDEADAGAVWETMCVRMSPAYAAASGGLLRGRV